MAWMQVIGDCVACGRTFAFNADRVPSIRIGDQREPVCQQCFERLNRLRVHAGLDPVALLPGAYDPEEVS